MKKNNRIKIKIEEAIVDLDPRERYTLKKLSKKLKGANLSPENLAKMLPEAFENPGEFNAEMVESLSPLTEQAIDISVQRDPNTLSTSLFPVIGGAIRKALTKMLSEMVQTMNSGLESALSFKRLAWRIEARRTGKSFFEVMLAHTLEYSVDHVFLIHKSTSLLLASLSREGQETADDDMVSSMLSAIRQYIKDSLNLSQESGVEGIQAGEYTILVEEGPRAILALIVRGSPAVNLRATMADTLENIHVKLARPLKSFSGNVKEFEKNKSLLEPCLEFKQKGQGKKPLFAIVLLSIIGLAIIGFSVFCSMRRSNEKKFLESLNAEQGISLTSYKRSFKKTKVHILRDENAKKVDDILSEYPLAERFIYIIEKPYYSPDISRTKFKREIPQHLLDIVQELSEYNIYFEHDSGNLRPGQDVLVAEAGTLISRLIAEAEKEDFFVDVEITGHAAGGVQNMASIQVSVERANRAFDAFIKMNEGLVNNLRVRGVGVLEPVVAEELSEEDKIKNRTVTIKAIISEN